MIRVLLDEVENLKIGCAERRSEAVAAGLENPARCLDAVTLDREMQKAKRER